MIRFLSLEVFRFLDITSLIRVGVMENANSRLPMASRTALAITAPMEVITGYPHL